MKYTFKVNNKTIKWEDINEPVSIKTNGGYTVEEILNNANVSKNPKYWYRIDGTDKFLFSSNVAESWEFFDPDIENPVRNTNQIYLRFKDVSKFMEASNYYKDNKVYTPFAEGTVGYEKFWDKEEEKIDKGLIIDGVRLTGRHYWTINYGRMRAIPTDSDGNPTSKRKVWTFLRFLDHQYYIFHELDKCFLEGVYRDKDSYLDWFPLSTADEYFTTEFRWFTATKARRKGWSGIIGVGVVNYNFTWRESSNNIIAAYEKGRYGPILSMTGNTKSFVDQNTPFIRQTEILSQREHYIAGMKFKDEEGKPKEVGYLSEVSAISFKDQPFKSVGSSADLINIEEAGVFSNLLEAYPVSLEPLVRDGETIIGTIIAAGTAGDLESGGSEALYEFMYNPSSYNFISYDNIYENKDDDIGEAGWFIDDLWYSPKTMTKNDFLELDNNDRTKMYLDNFSTNVIDTVDKQGNSYRYLSNLILEKKRVEKKKTSVKAYQKFITQQPKYLSEAFLVNQNSPFEVPMAKERLAKLKTMTSYGFRYGEFTYNETGQVKFLTGDSYQPILEFPDKSENRYGCWVLDHDPVKINGEIQYGRYIAATDPIDLGADESSENKKRSLGSTFIVDTYTRQIVAEYTGRPADVDHYYEQIIRGLEYFNATLLYERDKGTRLYEYFKNSKKLYLLADEPSILKDRTQDRIATLKGVNATARINSDARGYLADWTLEDVRIDDETTIKRMYTIKFPGVLQEMINWNKDGNYDRISALGILMIYLRELTIVIDNNMSGEDPMKKKMQLFKRISGKKKNLKDYINEN